MPGSFHNLGEQLGDTSWLGDCDRWIAEAKDAGRRGDAAAEAAAWRKAQWWYQQAAGRSAGDPDQAKAYQDKADDYAGRADKADATAAQHGKSEALERGRIRAQELLFALRPFMRRVVDERLGELP